MKEASGISGSLFSYVLALNVSVRLLRLSSSGGKDRKSYKSRLSGFRRKSNKPTLKIPS